MSSSSFPHGRISDVQRRMMTTAAEPNVHAIAIEGTFDDCQALVKALFNDLAFRDRLQLAGVNSINWARIVAQIVYYFAAAAALGARTGRVQLLACRPATSATSSPATRARRMGLPDRAAGDRHQRERHPRPHAWRTGSYELRDVVATTSPSHGHPGLLQLRALPVRGRRPRRGLRARPDERPAPERLALEPRRASLPSARASIAARVDEDEVADCIRRVQARQRLSARSAYRLSASSPRARR